MLEIANETNSDAVHVGPIIRGPSTMSTGSLLFPSKRHFDLAVAAVRAVADNEIIAHAVPVVFLPVHSVKDRCVSIFCRGVVNDDSRPVFFQLSRRQPGVRNVLMGTFPLGLWRDD